jgi:hypothetical protein
VGEVRELCRVLSIRQEEFVVRLEQEAAACSGPGEAAGGGFQCRHCSKTFIYVKSFERHTAACQAEGRPAEGPPGRRGARKRNRKVAKDNEAEVQEGKQPRGDLFQFVHFEQTDSLTFCRFPGCDYHLANPGFR